MKSQLRGVTPDGPLQVEQPLPPDRVISQNGSVDGSLAAGCVHVKASIHAEQNELVGAPLHPESNLQQQTDLADHSVTQHNPPISTPYRHYDQHPESQQSTITDSQAHEVSPSIVAPPLSISSRPSESNSTLKSTPICNSRCSAKSMPSSKEVGDAVLVDRPLLSETIHSVHDASSRSVSVPLTTAQNENHGICESFSKISVADKNHRKHTRMTALENALDAIRNASLADQYRLEDQMAMRDNEWKDERSSLQTTITRQLETIVEQRIKLERCENRHSDLTDKLKSSQKFVSGLQRDHENLKRFVVAFQEQNKVILQEHIAKMLQEKEDLQRGFDVATASCARSQKTMLGAMHEIQLKHVTALLRENNLKGKLDERVAMYEEEKARRIELEQQLLPSVRAVQSYLNKSSATLLHKINNVRASLEVLKDEDGGDSRTKECLLILQRLQSLPLLTSGDVQKAEVMLRDIYEK